MQSPNTYEELVELCKSLLNQGIDENDVYEQLDGTIDWSPDSLHYALDDAKDINGLLNQVK
ncbi:hypothetical protein [Psychrobacillus phage Perkons]|nr:hypothetical protein [Psychrobacillus phage Perkons]